MALPASDSISMLQVAGELGVAKEGLGLNDARVRALAGKPTDATTIAMSDLRGKSSSTHTLTVGTTSDAYGSSVGYASTTAKPFGGITPTGLGNQTVTGLYSSSMIRNSLFITLSGNPIATGRTVTISIPGLGTGTGTLQINGLPGTLNSAAHCYGASADCYSWLLARNGQAIGMTITIS